MSSPCGLVSVAEEIPGFPWQFSIYLFRSLRMRSI